MTIRIIAETGGITSTPITVRRPKWNDVYKNYPKNATGTDDMFGPDFYKMIFGDDYDQNTFMYQGKIRLYNGCAGKVSMALSLSGLEIKKLKTIGRDFIASEGKMKGKGFISTASKMKLWLDEVWKKDGDIKLENPNSINNIKSLIGNKKGIYLMLAKNANDFGASGHVTLWFEGKAFGGHDYATSAKSMYFWELI